MQNTRSKSVYHLPGMDLYPFIVPSNFPTRLNIFHGESIDFSTDCSYGFKILGDF